MPSTRIPSQRGLWSTSFPSFLLPRLDPLSSRYHPNRFLIKKLVQIDYNNSTLSPELRPSHFHFPLSRLPASLESSPRKRASLLLTLTKHTMLSTFTVLASLLLLTVDSRPLQTTEAEPQSQLLGAFASALAAPGTLLCPRAATDMFLPANQTLVTLKEGESPVFVAVGRGIQVSPRARESRTTLMSKLELHLQRSRDLEECRSR